MLCYDSRAPLNSEQSANLLCVERKYQLAHLHAIGYLLLCFITAGIQYHQVNESIAPSVKAHAHTLPTKDQNMQHFLSQSVQLHTDGHEKCVMAQEGAWSFTEGRELYIQALT